MVLPGRLFSVALMGIHHHLVKAFHHRSLKNHDNELDIQTVAAHYCSAHVLHRILDGEEPCTTQLSECEADLSALSDGCEEEVDLIARLLELTQELLEALFGRNGLLQLSDDDEDII